MRKRKKPPSSRKLWTESEIEYLKNNIGIKTYHKMAIDLGRSEEAIRVKIKRLGLGGYAQNTDLLTLAEAGEILGVDRKCMWLMARQGKLKVKKVKLNSNSKRKFIFLNIDEVMKFKETYQKRQNRRWNRYEVSMLKAYYQASMTDEKIAEKLSRSVRAIQSKRQELHITRKRKRGQKNA